MSGTLAISGGSPVRREAFRPQNTIGAEERAAVLEVLDSGVLSGFVADWGDEFFGGQRVRSLRAGIRATPRCHASRGGELGHHRAAGGALRGRGGAGRRGDSHALHHVRDCLDDPPPERRVRCSQTSRPETYGLDPERVAPLVNDRTRAIVVVHLFGHPARMDGLLEIAERHGLALIEDAAQSIGATWRGKQTGNIRQCRGSQPQLPQDHPLRGGGHGAHVGRGGGNTGAGWRVTMASCRSRRPGSDCRTRSVPTTA